jgi:hypothetical protein
VSVPDAIFDFVRKCTHCPADIVWVTEDESRFPVTAEPQPNGNLTLTPRGRELLLGRPTKLAADGMRAAGLPLYLRHALTCPMAHKWSKNTTGYGFAKTTKGGERRTRKKAVRRR